MSDFKCPVCGAPLNGGKCDYCGYQADNQGNNGSGGNNSQPNIIINNVQQAGTGPQYYVAISSKSKMVALILCIFLGYIGMHRFYVGKIGTGILYLFTGGLFGIGWIIDILKIATGTFSDGAGMPLKN